VTTAPATFNSATIATDAPRVSIENNTALQVQKVLSSVTFSTPTPQESTKAIHLNVAQVAAQRPNMPINVTINGVPQTTTAAAIAKIDPTVQVALANPATVSAQPTETINMNVTQVAAKHPDMPINVTINGVTQTATAAAIAKVDPTIQVAVAYVPAFQRTAVKGGHDSHSNHGPHVQGDNNGNSNQHANAMGAHGQNGQRSGRSAAGNF
ncbi:hypothetical protein, partial [Pantoea conspicua]|uniref:hypothetical protein n=1 Tax=Pantoea conspicua TaxID=472705 RepID=UPI001301B9F7